MKTVDLGNVIRALGDVQQTALEVDGLEYQTDNGRKSRVIHNINRDLLQLSDTLAFLSAQVRQEYWNTKGEVV
jgi:hypothetical protein